MDHMDTPEVCDGDDEMPLPGFRFHPTDEELVSFYLRRKVEKRPISLELIKQIDIYKHNPWDLPYGSCSSGGVGEKEWYFFCRRGRKYKNSIRPNRVTGSGFWKATGIDKPVYSNGGEGNECIGLKKTLVYYRGSAGKGTKTDWMMHEFRLPPPNPNPTHQKLQPNSKNFAEQAEIWTLCRIFKRNVSCRRYGSNWNKQTTTTAMKNPMSTHDNKNSSANNDIRNLVVPDHHQKSEEISYINFSCESMIIHNQLEKKPILPNYHPNEWNSNNSNYHQQVNSSCCSMAPSPVSSSGINISAPITSFPTITNQLDVSDFFTNSNWDELRSMVGML